MKKASVFLLLGGFFGSDGWVTSAGMLALRSMLQKLPGVTVKTYTWSDYQSARADLSALSQDSLAVVVGYSGGGSRATWLADELLAAHSVKAALRSTIDLMVLYDPSPRWQMKSIGSNVKRATTYQNPNATLPSFYGMLGGGVLTRSSAGPHIEVVPISANHIFVQADSALHARTVNEISKLLI